MINLDDIVEKNYIDESGKYTMTVRDVKFVTTKNGNPCHTFECETDDHEFIKLSIYLTEKSMWKYKNFIKTLGHPGTGTIDPEAVSRMCVGKKFVGTVGKQITENVITGEKEESKYFEITKFEKA